MLLIGGIFVPKNLKRDLAVRGLDALLDYQRYPVLAAELSIITGDPLWYY